METEQTAPEWRVILRHLAAEITLQRIHVKLLSAQRMALVQRDHEGFVGLQPEHGSCLADLSSQAEERRRLLRGRSMAAVFASWPEAEQTKAKALARQLRQLLKEARMLCAQNAAMINNELRYADFLLDIFVKAGRKRIGYLPKGKGSACAVNLFLNQVA
jgi:hypothetical protein